MRLVHLSDLHLGYRQYQRLTPTGINQREWDVANTFRRAIDRVIDIAPELIVVSGDVFHSSRPTNAAILHAFRQFMRLRTSLPETRIVVIAGDHDTPRTTESGSIMGLFEQIGLHVAASEPRQFHFAELETSVLAIPDGHDIARMPNDAAKHNVLVMHCDVDDVVPRYYAELDRATVKLSRGDLAASRWSYVALGHYHSHQRVADNAFYAGSLDFTSLNVWFDLDEHPRKGFVVFDLETGEHRFEAVEESRAFIDLAPIDARDLSVVEVNAAIQSIVERVKGGIDDKVVRLVVRDIPRAVARELDHRLIREYKRRALSFHLDTRRPEITRRDAAGAPVRRPSVAEFVRQKLVERPLPPEIERERVVELGLKYLNDADAFPSAAATTAIVAEPEG
ncbi:MAG TPA: metallophosphoesterase [Gemmatimonadaceae bacterium]|nr:metallophosphoesterase [Gemmatimonadaceae bacterium]